MILIGLARLYDKPWPVAIETGLLLGPGGEFAFVGIGMATALQLIPSNVSSFALAVTSLSMALIPLLSVVARKIRKNSAKPIDPDLKIAPANVKGHAIVVGHGRVGQTVCTMLDRHRFPYLAVDSDPNAVVEYRKGRRDVYYGDATSPAFLNTCGLADATAVVVTIHTQSAIDEIVKLVRAIRPDIVIVSRARDAAHARRLYAIGVTDAVPETIEASLQLSEAMLVGLGLPAGLVIASIHQMRDEFRYELQEAAGRAGQKATHSIRQKTVRTS